MGFLQKECRTTGKKALAYRGKGGQNTDTAFLALRLGVVLYLLIYVGHFLSCSRNMRHMHMVWRPGKGVQISAN